jgi:hypothetical protein
MKSYDQILPSGGDVATKSKATPRLRRQPSIFTVDVDGQSILSFEAANFREAAEMLKEGWFLDDLRTLNSDGRPLWDGTARLQSRLASEAEAERYHAMADEAGDEAGDLLLAFHLTLDGR